MSLHHRGPFRDSLRKSARQRLLRVEALEARRVLAAAIDSQLWQDVESSEISAYEGTSYIAAVEYDLFSLDEESLVQGLVGTPHESSQDVDLPTIAIPRPDGEFERFQFVSSPVYAPEFAEKFPEIQTFLGQGIDDPSASVRFDVTPHGFHAQVLSPSGGYIIDPYFHLSDHDIYASYFKAGEYDMSVYETTLADSADLDHLLHDHDDDDDEPPTAGFGAGSSFDSGASGNGTGAISSGTELRTYRAAIAAAGDYTVFHGGTVALAQAAIVTSLNRIVGVLEQELSVRFELVPNNDQIAYTNPATDPYTDGGNLFPNLAENQATVDSIIGVDNYDIGHLFKTGGGGLAYLRSIGVDALKAGAATSITPPVGEYFNVVTMHEMGHQMGANHTFSGDSGGCAGNANPTTAVEPGGGSTIMSYAGICGNDDLQALMDANYHSVSVDEILAHIDGTIAGVGGRSNPVNSIPSVAAGSNFTIPAGTPFVLTAIGFDADGNDTLTYSWEQRDVGPQRDLAAGDDGISTLFRVYPPSPTPARYFPRLEDLVNGTLSPGETMPATNRNMNYRVTVRDNNVGAGAINTSDMSITVVDTGTPFTVLTPNTAVTWDGLSQQTITWNVAGTTAAPISASEVSLYFSADGGLSYPITIAENLPNTGSATIFVPNVDTTQGRVMVRGANNVFFDISDEDITVDAIPIDIQLDSGAAVFVEDSPPVPVTPGAKVLVAGNLAGLSVDVSIGQGSQAGDQLSVLSTGGIAVTSTSVSYNGLPIGTYSNSGGVISVRLNSNADAISTEAFVRAIAFENTTDSPTSITRRVDFVFGSTILESRAINVQPVNDPPTISNAQLPAIPEDTTAPVGPPISQIMLGKVDDPDSGSSLLGLAVVSNPLEVTEGAWFFSDAGQTWLPIGNVDDANNSLVIPSTALLGFVPRPDYFGAPTPLSVRALDDSYSGPFSSTNTGALEYLDPAIRTPTGPVSLNVGLVGISVTNVNDAPVANESLIAINILQDEPIDRSFATTLFSDIDSTSLTYRLRSANGGPLPTWMSFDSATRQVSGTPRNRDVGSYSLLLSATDSDQASAQIPVVVNVANVNDAPINLRLTGRTVSENRSDVVIGDLFANDPDPGDLVFWSTSDTRFIVRDSSLVLTSPVDFETEQTIDLILTAVDTGTPSASSQLPVTIQVTDENEFFPQLAGEVFSIPDGTAAGTVLRTLSAPDGDTQQTVSFRLKSGDTSFFNLNTTTGELSLRANADFATKSSYLVFVEAYDNGTPLKAKTSQFIVNVTPVNQFAPSIPPVQTLSFQENLPTGVTVGNVLATDQDGDPLQFEIINEVAGQEGWLAINAATGALTTTASAKYDFEAAVPHTIEVRVTESVAPFRVATGTVTLNVTDVNDPPTAISEFTIPTSQMGYLTTGGFTITDQDPAAAYTLATTDARFEIRGGQLALRPSVFFDDAVAGTTTEVMLTVTDAGDPTSLAQLPARINIRANPSPWQNPLLHVDVNRSGDVTASDVLSVVNAINLAGGQTTLLSRPRTLAEYSMPDIDVSGDNVLTALDALLVVNYVNANPAGEGEPSRAPVQPEANEQLWLSAFTALEEELKRRGR